MFDFKNVISIKDFNKEDINFILDEAEKMEPIAKSEQVSNELEGKILGLMFFEPSTRTKLSFETAMKRLGGRTIGISKADTSSISKGENLADTSKMIEAYSDVIAMRHNLEGAAQFVSELVDVPVINAGDGATQHPTQTLLDIYTMRRHFGKIEGLKVAMVGDLKYGRTVHSLAYALGIFGVEMTFVSPEELQMPNEVLHDLEKNNIKFNEIGDVKDVLDDVDVLYVTRIQKERFADIEEYNKIKGAYLINKELLEGKDLIVMHPLPRIDEIAHDIDDTKYNMYFKQAFYAVPVRMAILKNLFKNNHR
ncbi:MAG: aspartate carbamoyltransferase [Methanobacteriaceae archaeon]